MEVGEPTTALSSIPEPRRFGMRAIADDALAQAYRASGLLCVVAALAGFAVYFSGREDFSHPNLVAGVSALSLSMGLALTAIERFAPEFALRRAPWIVHPLLLATGLTISLGLYGAGPDEFMITTIVYLQPLIFGCYLLKTPYAFVHIGVIAMAFGFVLAQSDPISHPFEQLLFLISIGAAGALVLGRLADTASATAVSEYEARRALAEVNDTLEHRVAEQVDELERLGRLRRFLSKPVADAIAADTAEILAPHRRPIAVFFCDLRGFTSFAANAEPEDVVDVLGEYYRTMGHHLDAHKATFGSFAGDGVMAYFGDPLPVDNPARAALTMAIELATALDTLVHQWHLTGYELNFGIGITYGHATLGVVGYEERSEYTALGSVVNLAARLSDQAAGGQILLDGRAATCLGETDAVQPAGDRVLKGMAHPVAVFEAVR